MRRFLPIAMLLIACSRAEPPPPRACWGNICEPDATTRWAIQLAGQPPPQALQYWRSLIVYLRYALETGGEHRVLKRVAALTIEPQELVFQRGYTDPLFRAHVTFRCDAEGAERHSYHVEADPPIARRDLLYRIRNRVRNSCAPPRVFTEMMVEIAHDQLRGCVGEPIPERDPFRLLKEPDGIGLAENWHVLIEELGAESSIGHMEAHVLIDPVYEEASPDGPLFWADLAIRCTPESDGAIAVPAEERGLDSLAFQSWVHECAFNGCAKDNGGRWGAVPN
jgi:hypothetical protein